MELWPRMGAAKRNVDLTACVKREVMEFCDHSGQVVLRVSVVECDTCAYVDWPPNAVLVLRYTKLTDCL